MSKLQEWQEVTIDSISKVINGGTPKSSVSDYWDGSNLWITPAEMGGRKKPYLEESRRKLTDAGLKKSSAKPVPPYSVILSTRAPIGHLVINTKPMAFNQGCRGIVPDNNLHYKFLYYFLFSKIDLLNDLGTGTTFKELSATKLKSVSIPFPPLPEQKRIVAILDEAFAGIEKAVANTEKNLANVRELFEGYLNSVFSSNDEDWTKTTLGEIADFKNGLNFRKNSKGERVKIVGVKDFQSNYWIPMSELATVQVEGKLSEAYKLKRNDILTVRSNGNKKLIGRCILAHEVPEVTSHSGFTIRIRIVSSDVEPLYLVHYLKTDLVRELLINSGEGVNISSLNQKALSMLPVPVPEKNKQNEIVKKIEALKTETSSLKNLYQQKLTALAELKQSLLQKAFSGELTAEDKKQAEKAA